MNGYLGMAKGPSICMPAMIIHIIHMFSLFY